MHVLLEKYKLKLTSLPLGLLEKEQIEKDFEQQLLFRLINEFYRGLTIDEKKQLEETRNDEELMETYITLILNKIDRLDFLNHLDEIYIKVLTEAINSLP